MSEATEKKVWDYLVSNGMTEWGAAGMMGNMKAESGIIANRVEILCLKRLKENGKSYTDETYTAAVDSGAITREGFLNPLPGKQYGYGLCQWTSPSRKVGLYDLCKKKGVSISNLEAQLEFLVSELKTSYKSVWNTLKSAKTVKTASNSVLTKFEIPADVSEAVKKTRIGYGEEIYNRFHGSQKQAGSEGQAAKSEDVKTLTEEQAIQMVINVAEGEIGYLEKASNANLDSKTGNAGYNNYTKYWRDLYPAFQAQYWCAIFVAWCFYKAFGLDLAKKLLKHWPYTYCPTLASMTTNKTPKVGSVILFYNGGTYTHTGLVVAVSAMQVTTIEGNTTGASGVIANGGGVCKKTYNRSSLSAYTKYFIPDRSTYGNRGVHNRRGEGRNRKRCRMGQAEIRRWLDRA